MWGTTALSQQIGPLQQALANPHNAQVLPIGATIAWDNVSAAGGDATLADGTKIITGEKYILRGTVMCRVTTAEQQKIQASTAGNAWSGGTFDLGLTKLDEFGSTVTANASDYNTAGAELPYNISAADLQAILVQFYGAGKVTVTFGSSAWTVTFDKSLGNVTAMTADITNVTSAGTAAVTMSTLTGGDADGGSWAPYNSGATDGTQTLTRENVAIINNTIKLANNAGGLNTYTADSKISGLYIGGLFFYERLGVDGSGQPSLTALLAVMPLLRTVRGDS